MKVVKDLALSWVQNRETRSVGLILPSNFGVKLACAQSDHHPTLTPNSIDLTDRKIVVKIAVTGRDYILSNGMKVTFRLSYC